MNNFHVTCIKLCIAYMLLLMYVRKKAKIRNLYNQVPHLTQDTIWQRDKNTRKHYLQECQEVSHFPAGDHKAARKRQNTNNKKDPQKKHHLGTVSKKITGGLMLHGYIPTSPLILKWIRIQRCFVSMKDP